MKVIRPNCRSQFTAADFDFLLSVLPIEGSAASGLTRLFEDPESLDRLLDQPRLFRAILELRGCIGVSLHFYFYVLVRNALLREAIRDRVVADYVAEMLSEFAVEEKLNTNRDENHVFEYFHEMLEALERLSGEKRFAMQTHIGNYALFHSGLFPGRLRHRAERRGAPGVRFYEELGSAHFRMAGNHALARRFDMAPLFLTLGQAFHLTRLALNHLSGNLVFLETDRKVRDLLREIETPEAPSDPNPPG